MKVVKRLQLAAVATVTLLISGCSRVTTVSERRDYQSPGGRGKSIEVTESWALPGFLKGFISNLLAQGSFLEFMMAWGFIGCIGAVIMAIMDV
jgi:hypothetical protein